MVVGLAAAVISIASAVESLYSDKGCHPVAVFSLQPGVPLRETFAAKSGKRYLLGLQVYFERDGLAESEGAHVVRAQFPVRASLEDTKIIGWLNPEEPPTVLYDRTTDPTVRPEGIDPNELVAERTVGPYLAPSDRQLAFDVDLGIDRIATAKQKHARVVVYNDALPRSITLRFVAGAGGATAFIAGAFWLFVNFFRARSRTRQRRPRR